MTTVTIKVIGAAPGLVQTIEFDVQKVANAISENITGRKASDNQANQIDQAFIDRNSVQVRYASGTFMGFKFADSAMDEFEKFTK